MQKPGWGKPKDCKCGVYGFVMDLTMIAEKYTKGFSGWDLIVQKDMVRVGYK